MTKQDKLYEILKAHTEGVEMEEIKKQLKVSRASVYSLISDLRKMKLKIKNINSVYKLYGETNEAAKVLPRSPKNFPDNPIQNLAPEIINRLDNVPSGDLSDVLDMLKKSIFYKKSALALIEANEFVETIKLSMRRRLSNV